MRLGSSSPRPRTEESLIPLIDIAFLILIFFLIASTIKPFSDREVKLAEIEASSSSAATPRMLIIRSDGALFIGTQPLIDSDLPARFTAWSEDSILPVTIVADRKLKAVQLIDLVARARAAGLMNVKLLTRRIR